MQSHFLLVLLWGSAMLLAYCMASSKLSVRPGEHPIILCLSDCPLCQSATLLSYHVINLILLTPSEQYLAIYNGGNVFCHKMVLGKRCGRARESYSENKRVSNRKRR